MDRGCPSGGASSARRGLGARSRSWKCLLMGTVGGYDRLDPVPPIALVARQAAPVQTKSAMNPTAVPSARVVAAAPASVRNVPVMVPTGVPVAALLSMRLVL